MGRDGDLCALSCGRKCSRSSLRVRNLAPQLWVDLEGTDLNIWGPSRVQRLYPWRHARIGRAT